MRWYLAVFVLALWVPACGGGGSGGSDVNPQPGTPFALTFNTGLAITPAFTAPAAIPPYLAIPVREGNSGADLNGDGDQLDNVLHVINTATDETINLGYAVTGPVLASARRFAFLVIEAAQGSTDLNQDSDTRDAVWLVYEPAQPTGLNNPINTLVATPALGLPAAASSSGFVFLESESAQGLFLNGDLDQTDNVIAVFDDRFNAIVPVAVWTHATGTEFVARNGRVLVALGEPDATADLNRDGDALDIVLGCVDFTTSFTVLHPVGGIFPRAVGTHPYALTDDAAVYFIDEASEANFDFNGDGDSTDAIIAVYDVGNGTGEQRPQSPLIGSMAIAGRASMGIGAGAERAVVAVDEAAQGSGDLNGDMDSFDNVVAWIDTANAPGVLNVRPFALGQHAMFAQGVRGLVTVDENASGAVVGVDLNGDTDTDDQVAFMLDMEFAPGTMVNLGFPVVTMDLRGPDALLGVPETGHFGQDLNGNGQVNEVVRFYFDFSDSTPSLRGLGVVASAVRFFRLDPREVRMAAAMPEGQSASFLDMNNDGDTNDTVIMLVGVDPGTDPPGTIASTPFFAGTGSFFQTPPLRVGNDVFAFPTMEVLAGTDLNGDGDQTDTILSYVRYTPKNG